MGEDVPLCLSPTVPCIRAATTVLLLGVEASMVEGSARHLQELAGAAPPLQQCEAQGCQAAPATSASVHSAEGTLRFLFHQLANSLFSPAITSA